MFLSGSRKLRKGDRKDDGRGDGELDEAKPCLSCVASSVDDARAASPTSWLDASRLDSDPFFSLTDRLHEAASLSM